MEFTFDLEKNKEKILEFKGFLSDHKDMPGALIPALQEAQVKFGYLPQEVMEIIARGLDVPASKVFGVATYYSQFTFIPKGKHNISICLGTACYVKGAQGILEEFENILGIKGGETTPDLQFSITDCRCVGDCSIAPVVVVDEDVYAKVKKADVKDIIQKYSLEVECVDN
ncbi:NAD(P)H-dependent oxidoreductase subunit E [Alkalibaculum bacchi]|uniref:NADH-quinone oxidoreductase subunit NuoE family protein n=1 Tax=Alkalibaculum bacchi TaxID=645887 RepID=UPI0026EA3C6D|nr:NAD(P)H-dependent oxidoreductase subunit E [Alkalibaculum bacchi]